MVCRGASGGRLGASAICRAARVPLFVGDGGGTGYDAREAGACAGGGARFSACCRETEPVCCMLDYSLRIFCLVCVVVLGNQDTAISSTVGGTTDPNWEGVQALSRERAPRAPMSSSRERRWPCMHLCKLWNAWSRRKAWPELGRKNPRKGEMLISTCTLISPGSEKPVKAES